MVTINFDSDKSLDSFTYHVLRRIDPTVLDNLTPQQTSAIVQALKACGPKRHPVDIRGVIPLIFDRFYFVFLMGYDRRLTIRNKEESVSKFQSILGKIIFLVMVVSPVIVLGFLLVNLGMYAGKIFTGSP